MECNFSESVQYVFEREQGYVNDPNDPGGPTNLGITQNTLSSWRKEPASVSDVKNLTKIEAAKIYHKKYWQEAWCGALPSGLDLLVFDFAVNAGPSTALKLLERKCGIGIPPQSRHRPRTYKETLKRRVNEKAHEFGLEETIMSRLSILCGPGIICGFTEEKLAYYRSLSSYKYFGRGWTNRAAATQRVALNLWASSRTH